MTDTIIKPCPFCGQPATSTKTYVGCLSCDIGSSINPPYGSNERQAWNTRTPDLPDRIPSRAAPMYSPNIAQLLKDKEEMANTINDLLRAYEQSRSETIMEGVEGISLMRVRAKEATALLDRLSTSEQEHKT